MIIDLDHSVGARNNKTRISIENSLDDSNILFISFSTILKLQRLLCSFA